MNLNYSLKHEIEKLLKTDKNEIQRLLPVIFSKLNGLSNDTTFIVLQKKNNYK